MRLAIYAAVLLFSLGLFAESKFPSQMANPAQTGVADIVPVAKARIYKWKLKLPEIYSHQSVQTVLAPDGKSVYLCSGPNLLQVDIEKGEILSKLKNKVIGHPAISKGMLYVTGADFLHAYDISGGKPALKWEYKLAAKYDTDNKYNHAHRSGPLVTDKLVLFGQGGGKNTNVKIFAVEKVSGKAAFEYTCKGRLYSLLAWDEKNDFVFGAGEGAGLFAVDLKTGKEVWSTDMPGANFSGPGFKEGVVYCGGDSELGAFSAKDGKMLWRIKRKTTGTAGPARPVGHSIIIGKEMLITNSGKNVEAYSLKDGSFVWTYKTAGEGAGFMTAAGDTLYVPDFSAKGFIHGVNIKDGKRLWNVTAQNFKADYVGISDGKFFFSTLAGELYCFEEDKH
jgi:outer membrane protein assembly factor BamB